MTAAAHPFGELERGVYGAIAADPAWTFRTWSERGMGRSPKYQTMPSEEIAALPVAELAAPDCALFLWATWPTMPAAFRAIERWQFTYKTCAFAWLKADPHRCPIRPAIGLGYWTRANTEVCLLATRGTPKRLHADVGQVIIAPRREHSRKPEEAYERIERLVGGYLELFARATRPGWTVWGDESASSMHNGERHQLRDN
jgi:N6-adenosine-specific RNA methylase IME4